MTRAGTQARLDQALTRLLAGQTTVTDGALTVANLCREAGVGRDSYYRSPQPFRERFAAACGNQPVHQPELVRLRDEIAVLKRQRKQADRDHAAAIRELDAMIKTYANQIQMLALRIAELAEDNERLRVRIARGHNGTVRALPNLLGIP